MRLFKVLFCILFCTNLLKPIPFGGRVFEKFSFYILQKLSDPLLDKLLRNGWNNVVNKYFLFQCYSSSKEMNSRVDDLFYVYSKSFDFEVKRLVLNNLNIIKDIVSRNEQFSKAHKLKQFRPICYFFNDRLSYQNLRQNLFDVACKNDYGFIEVDCSLLDVSKFDSRLDYRIFCQTSFFTDLYLRLPKAPSLIYLKNIDALLRDKSLQSMKFFFENFASPVDPCLNDSISFKGNLIICSSSSLHKNIIQKNFPSMIMQKCQIDKPFLSPFAIRVNDIPPSLQDSVSDDFKLAIEYDLELMTSLIGTDRYLEVLQHLTLLETLDKVLRSRVDKTSNLIDFNKLSYLPNELINGVKNYLALDNAFIDGAGIGFLIHGPPGVGKTYFAQTLSKLLNKPLYVVSCGALFHQAQLVGWPRSYKDAKLGLLAEALIQFNRKDGIILFDECDKCFSNSEAKVLDIFLQLLDSRNKNVFENYLGIGLDFSKCLFLFSANDVQKIPEPLVDRCMSVLMPALSVDAKFMVCKESIIPSFIEKISPEKRGFIRFTDEMILGLVQKDNTPGLRSLEREIYFAGMQMLSREHTIFV